MNNKCSLSEFYAEILLTRWSNGEEISEWELDKLTEYIEKEEK